MYIYVRVPVQAPNMHILSTLDIFLECAIFLLLSTKNCTFCAIFKYYSVLLYNLCMSLILSGRPSALEVILYHAI